MSISITISNINDLTDTERAVLRFVADRATADSLKEAVRDLRKTIEVAHSVGMPEAPAPVEQYATDPHNSIGEALASTPVEPEEVYSPHAVVLDTPPAQWVTPVAPVPVTPPIALVPTPPAPSGSAELDANGLPWDKRIHASTRTKVAAGTWKYARGVDGDYIAQVERELRAVQAIPVPIAQQVAAFTQALPQLESAYGGGDVVATLPPAPTVPLPPLPQAPPATLPMTFAQLMQHVTPLLVSGKLNQPILQRVVESCGLPHLAALGARPDLVETVRAAIDAEVGGVQ